MSVVFVAAMFLNILDTTIVNTTIPTIGADFGTSVSRTGAVASAYLVSIAVVIPASGWLGDRFGTRRIFLIALTLFTAASAPCAVAGSFGRLVAFRVLQGVGVGLGALMFCITEGPARGWDSVGVLAPGLGGLVLFALLARRELGTRFSMLDLRIFRDRLFRSSVLVVVPATAGFLRLLYAFPLLRQESFGRTATESGLLTFPEAIGVMAGSQLVSRLYAHFGPRRLISGGAITVGLMALALTPIDGVTGGDLNGYHAAFLTAAALLALGAAMAWRIRDADAAPTRVPAAGTRGPHPARTPGGPAVDAGQD